MGTIGTKQPMNHNCENLKSLSAGLQETTSPLKKNVSSAENTIKNFDENVVALEKLHHPLTKKNDFSLENRITTCMSNSKFTESDVDSFLSSQYKDSSSSQVIPRVTPVAHPQPKSQQQLMTHDEAIQKDIQVLNWEDSPRGPPFINTTRTHL